MPKHSLVVFLLTTISSNCTTLSKKKDIDWSGSTLNKRKSMFQRALIPVKIKKKISNFIQVLYKIELVEWSNC